MLLDVPGSAPAWGAAGDVAGYRAPVRRQAAARGAARGGRRSVAAALGTVLGAVVLAGCTGFPTTPTPPTTATTPAPSSDASSGTAAPDAARPTADEIRERGAALTAGDVTLAVMTSGAAPIAEALTTETLDDGSARLTLDVPDGAPAPALVVTLAAPSGAVFDVQVDGSVVLRAADGSFAGGLAAPTARASEGAVTAQFSAVADDVLDLAVTSVTLDATLPAATATLWLGAQMLDSPADWGEREGGRSLAVRPTAWARAGGLAAQEGMWAAVVAQEPEADTNGMRDQLLCHALGAPDKESWNLEPWRPDVGSFATLAARCNPT